MNSFAVPPRLRARRHILSLLLIVIMAAGWLIQPLPAAAHAVAESFTPEPGAQMEESPPEIAIAFNEQIEAQIGSLRVLDSQSRPVTDERATVSDDRTTIRLAIPELSEDVYTVAYSIISADGHPVSGSYIFVVGDPPGGRDASSFNLHEQMGHTGHAAATQLTTAELALYAARILYYLAMLIAAGVMLWYAMLRNKNEVLLGVFRSWGLWLMRAYLVAALLYVFVHSRELMVGQPSEDWLRLFTRTEIGLTWAAIVVVALLGFLVLRGGRAIRAIWALTALGLEGWSGHASAYEPLFYSLGLNFIHIAASAVWAGGLFFLLTLWFEERKDAGRFAETFTTAAWLSILLLTITGVLSALLFIPRPDYLFYTAWGTLLIIKTGLVLLVIAVGFLLRLRIKRGNLPAGSLLKADAVLMALIIAVVGIFTYISPLPANEPVSEHLMGEEMHITLRITPNVPGADNHIITKVWLPDELGEPKSVTLLLRSLDQSDLGAIEIPIEPYDDEEVDTFTGFTKATYQATGRYIPFAGEWQAQIRIRDSQDVERVHEEIFRNY
ncbi:copper resistance CopC/CopD family protein [Paenibacillus sp. 1P07SE]|uniref:copper resistance CopC/CopD family protein n=1 Tax=Paenibacillus sp. 1P07SE TaxID=3132209 RepID=UPI0039A75016